MEPLDGDEPGRDGPAATGAVTVPRSSIGRNIGALLASQMTTWILATLLAIVQPRFLGPTAQGELRLAFSLWTIAQVLIGLGTALYLTLEIARDRTKGLAYVGPVLVLRTFAFVAASFVLAIYVVATGADDGFLAIMAVFGLSIFFATMADAISAVFMGLERMSVLARATVIAKVVGTVVAIVVLLAGGDALSVVVVLAAANFLGLLILVKAFRSVTTVTFRGWRSQWRHIDRGKFSVPSCRRRSHHVPTARHGDHVAPRRQRRPRLVQHGGHSLRLTPLSSYDRDGVDLSR